MPETNILLLLRCGEASSSIVFIIVLFSPSCFSKDTNYSESIIFQTTNFKLGVHKKELILHYSSMYLFSFKYLTSSMLENWKRHNSMFSQTSLSTIFSSLLLLVYLFFKYSLFNMEELLSNLFPFPLNNIFIVSSSELQELSGMFSSRSLSLNLSWITSLF